MPVVEPPLALLQVQVEGLGRHPVELLEAALGEAPEALDAVDVARPLGELARGVVNPQVLRVPDIDQPAVAAPRVGVDDRVERDAPTNGGLQRLFAAVGYDLGVDAAVTLEDAEDDGLCRPAPTPAPRAAGAEVGLVDFDLAGGEGRGALALLGEAAADFAKDRDDRAVRDAGQLGRVGGT